MSALSSLLSEKLQTLHDRGLHRKRRVIQPGTGEVHFCSNDYLSLSDDPRVKQAYQQGFERYPAGSGGSAVICGYHAMHAELEQTLSSALQTDAAVLFSSGYAANLAVMNLLANLGCSLLLDKGMHASFYDGIKLAQADFHRYQHNDMADLKQKLAGMPQPAVLTEGIFSMSGQIAPLTDIVAWSEAYHAPCLVDEAHAFGLLGEHGLGAVSHFSLSQKHIPLRIIPFGKALGGQGAVVTGGGDWIDALVQYGRSYIYSTAISPALAYGLLKTFHLMYEADERRQKVRALVDYFRQHIAQSPLPFADSRTAIQQVQLGCPHAALAYSEHLLQHHIFCQAIREPTVPRKNSGLRIVLNYRHEFKDIDFLFNQLHAIYDTIKHTH